VWTTCGHAPCGFVLPNTILVGHGPTLAYPTERRLQFLNHIAEPVTVCRTIEFYGERSIEQSLIWSFLCSVFSETRGGLLDPRLHGGNYCTKARSKIITNRGHFPLVTAASRGTMLHGMEPFKRRIPTQFRREHSGSISPSVINMRMSGVTRNRSV
jgi:hypothetical protein